MEQYKRLEKILNSIHNTTHKGYQQESSPPRDNSRVVFLLKSGRGRRTIIYIFLLITTIITIMKPDENHNLPYTLSRWFCSVFITRCIVHEVAIVQNAPKIRYWNCNMKPDWFTSHQSHYCKISGLLLLPFFLGKSSLQELASFGYYPAALIWRPGETVQNLESPGLLLQSFQTLISRLF